MRHLKTLFISAFCITLLSCAAARSEDRIPGGTFGATPPPDDKVLGVNEAGLEKNFGAPQQKTKGGCAIHLPGTADASVVGDFWLYTAETTTSTAKIFVCLFDGVAIDYKYVFSYSPSEGQLVQGQREVISFKLLQQLLDNKSK